MDPVGGTVKWAAGDTMQVVWGAINGGTGFSSGGTGFGMGFGGFGGQLVSFQSYDNLSDTTAAVLTRSMGTTAPINWANPPFGAAPKF